MSHYLERETIVALMQALARRPSELGPLAEADPAVLAFIREEVAPRLSAAGMIDQKIDDEGNLIATAGRGVGGSLLLIMNAMTQPAYDMPQPYEPRILSGQAYGIEGDVMVARGLSEQKANMAAMLAGIGAALSEGSPDGRLIAICCPSGETGRHDAIAKAMSSIDESIGMAILGGTSLCISLGNRGRIDLKVEVRGKTAHASRPTQGANAAVAACQIVQRVLEKGNGGTGHPVLGLPSLTLTSLRSFPNTSHTVQDLCIAEFDRRLLPGEDPHSVAAEIQQLVDAGAPYRDSFSGVQLSAGLDIGAFMYPSMVDADSPIVKAISRAAQTEIGIEPRLIHLPNAFDQGYLNHLGIPAVNFGCGEYAFAHTHDDIASIDRTVAAARIFRTLITDVTKSTTDPL